MNGTVDDNGAWSAPVPAGGSPGDAIVEGRVEDSGRGAAGGILGFDCVSMGVGRGIVGVLGYM